MASTGQKTPKLSHAAGPSAPARYESEWPGGRYSCLRAARKVGWQRKGVAKLEVRDEGSRESHRSAVVGRQVESRDQYGSSGQRQHLEASKQAWCVQLYISLIMLCSGSALDRTANAPHGRVTGAWRLLFEAYSPNNNARLVVMIVEVLSFPLDTNDVVNSLETMERELKEFERHAASTFQSSSRLAS